MADLTWKGRSTGALLKFAVEAIPPELIDEFGNPRESATYGGETVILANRDGSVRQPVATGVPAGDPDIYSAYVAFAPWDEVAG